MDDLASRMERARHALDPGWTPASSDLALTAVRVGLARRRTARAIAAATLALGALTVFLLPLGTSEIKLKDGSAISDITRGTRVAVLEESTDRVRVALSEGSAHFDVRRRPERTFEVIAGDVTVTVVGTSFTVARVGNAVRVAVQRGEVRVLSSEGQTNLRKGDQRSFERVEVAANVTAPSAPAPTTPSSALLPPTEAAPKSRAPRSRAASDPLAAAPRGASSSQPVSDATVLRSPAAPPAGESSVPSLDDLLSQADRARGSAQFEDAARLLSDGIRAYPRDERALLAAFTLGKILMQDLGRPAEAAEAFARVRQLSPSGPLAEDALAREAEACSAAGQVERARTRAYEYLERHPHGERVNQMRRLGGLQ